MKRELLNIAIAHKSFQKAFKIDRKKFIKQMLGSERKILSHCALRILLHNMLASFKNQNLLYTSRENALILRMYFGLGHAV